MSKRIFLFLWFSFIFLSVSSDALAQTCAPQPSGLVAWYPGNGNANDISVNHNNGTLQGGATFATGEVQQAFSFNGTSGFVSAPSSSANSVPGSFTIDAWASLNANPSVLAPIVSKWNDVTTGNRSYFLAFDSNGRVRFTIAPFGSCCVDAVSNSPVPLNQLTHVAGVFDASAGTLRVYINGVESVLLTNGSNSVFTSNEPLLIGAGDLAGARQFTNGLLDEVDLFNRALTQPEIQAIVNAGSAGKCLAPTAASVAVGGRVLAAKGRGLAGARVTSTNQAGETRYAMTNPFGYYRFDDVAAGETYIFEVRSKRCRFAPQVVSVTEDLPELNFVAEP